MITNLLITYSVFLLQLLEPLFWHLFCFNLHKRINNIKVKWVPSLVILLVFIMTGNLLITLFGNFGLITCLIGYARLVAYYQYAKVFSLNRQIVICCLVIYNIISAVLEYIYTFSLLVIFQLANLDYSMQPNLLRLMSFTILYLGAGLILLFMSKIKLTILSTMKEHHVFRLFVALLSADFIIFFFFSFMSQSSMEQIYNYGTFIALICELIFAVYAIKCINVSVRNERKTKTFLDCATSKIDMLERNQKSSVKADKIIHDSNNHILSIGYLLQEQQYEKAYEYVRQMMPELDAARTCITEKNVLFTLLFRKQLEAEKYNVSFDFIVGVKDVKIPIIDISTLIFNMSDNAIEYCRSHNKGRSGISYKIHIHNGELIFECFNMCDNEPERDSNGNFITTKEIKSGHGLGIAIMKECAERNGGILVTEFVEGLYIISARFNENLAIKYTNEDVGNHSFSDNLIEPNPL